MPKRNHGGSLVVALVFQITNLSGGGWKLKALNHPEEVLCIKLTNIQPLIGSSVWWFNLIEMVNNKVDLNRHGFLRILHDFWKLVLQSLSSRWYSRSVFYRSLCKKSIHVIHGYSQYRRVSLQVSPSSLGEKYGRNRCQSGHDNCWDLVLVNKKNIYTVYLSPVRWLATIVPWHLCRGLLQWNYSVKWSSMPISLLLLACTRVRCLVDFKAR